MDNACYYYFQGTRHPMSNLYKCSLTFRGQIYNSSEQAYQHQKALFHQDKVVADLILTATSGLHALHLAKNLKLTTAWEAEKVDCMRDVISCKLSQCPALRYVCREHQAFIWIEAAPSKFWGAGLYPLECQSTPRHQWPGQNTFGQILSDIARRYLQLDLPCKVALCFDPCFKVYHTEEHYEARMLAKRQQNLFEM